MTFIGVISSKNSIFDIKQYIKTNLQIKHEVIHINFENIENIKNVKFETILILDVEEVVSKLDYLKLVLKQTKYILINADIKINLEILEDISANVITFGFNNKSTITASSVEGENALICIQRNILDNNNTKIEPQEIKINIKNKDNIYNIMGIIGILLVYCEKNLEKFNKI